MIPQDPHKRNLVSTELKPILEPAFINDDVDASKQSLYVPAIASAAYEAVFRDRPDYMKPKHVSA